jgi:hypothetical protein
MCTSDCDDTSFVSLEPSVVLVIVYRFPSGLFLVVAIIAMYHGYDKKNSMPTMATTKKVQWLWKAFKMHSKHYCLSTGSVLDLESVSICIYL